MLQAAQNKDWEGVTRYEGTCAVLIEQLRLKSHDEPLAPDQRKEKARIMQRILRNDAQIRTLAEPWLAQFEHMLDRKSTRLNSSHLVISYAVFCLKKKK